MPIRHRGSSDLVSLELDNVKNSSVEGSIVYIDLLARFHLELKVLSSWQKKTRRSQTFSRGFSYCALANGRSRHWTVAMARAGGSSAAFLDMADRGD
jgi:hypothetical protein